ncbi:MAG: hypothetical protein WDN00_01920 [Limisphaerales bacterium]
MVDFTGLFPAAGEQETVDLTPYVGKTIQIVWYYQGIDIGTPALRLAGGRCQHHRCDDDWEW